uniref:RING-type domain-containing protein n=1 Tax=viral metagenome TaxID=1070528 RepID=A0A6C0H5S4_9ZZZZ
MFENIKEIEKKYDLIIDKNKYDEKMVLLVFNSLEIREEDYDLNDSNMLVVIGLYYLYVKKYYNNAKKYYLMAIEKGNASAMSNLGYLYYKLKDNENAKKYYLMAIEKGNASAMNNLGGLYFQADTTINDMIIGITNNLGIFYNYETNLVKAKKYFLMSIEKGNECAMCNLAMLFETKEKDYKNAIKYYLMAIEKGFDLAMNNLGNLYYVKKDYENAKKYYLMAIEKGFNLAMNNLGSLYYVKKDYENAKKYWLMAIEKGNDVAIKNIKIIMNEIELYLCLKEMENKNELIENEIKKLKKVKKVIEYENKLIYFGGLNNIKNCEICLDNNKLHLLMECGRHDICKDCFIKVKKCPHCRY